MRRFFITLLVICTLGSHGIKSQTNFVPGYILVTEKDTLFGVLDNREYNDNALFCDFKLNDSSSVTRYYPEKIYGYRFNNGKYYISKTIELDKKTTPVFLEFLIHGRLDIYFLQDGLKNGHYFASSDQLTIRELKYSQDIINDNGRLLEKESKDYIGVLNYLTRDCQQISMDIPKINEPDHKKLIKFAEKYHNLTCKDGSCIIYEKKIPKKIKLIVAGGGEKYMLLDTTFHRLYPTFGFNLLFQQSQHSENIYFGIGLYRMGQMDGIFAKQYIIPVSVNYINSKKGFSPKFSYEFNINMWLLTQSLRAGINYQMDNFSVFLEGNLHTFYLVKPFATGLNFGMTFDLR